MERAPHVHAHPLLAGALAGGCEISCTYPLQLLKTRLQLAAGGTYAGVVDCARQAIAAHGVRSLYRGLAPNLAFTLPRVGSRFAVFEGLVHSPGLQPLEARTRVLLAGACAGVVEATVAVIPMTTLEVRLVADQCSGVAPRFSGVAHAVRVIYAEEGIRGLYRGAGPTLTKITFNIASRFGLYDSLSTSLGRQWDALSIGGGAGSALKLSAVSIASGGIAGAVTAAANHPVDVIKSVMQGLDAKRYSSALHCGRSIVAAEGVGGLYKGLSTRLVRVVLETALTFLFYEHFSRALSNSSQRNAR